MPSAKKTTKEAPAKKKAAVSTKESVEKTKKVAVAKKEAATSEKAPTVVSGDRKALAAKARSLKLELLAIRFNLQSPSLNEYRKKRRELSATLAALN